MRSKVLPIQKQRKKSKEQRKSKEKRTKKVLVQQKKDKDIDFGVGHV